MDNKYLTLGHHILREGRSRGDRTGTGTKSIRSAKLVFDMREGFPLPTTKKVNLESVFHELKWILLGRTDVQFLEERKCGFIWRAWSITEPVLRVKRLSGYEQVRWLRENNPEAYALWVDGKYEQQAEEAGKAFMRQHNVPTEIDIVDMPAGETNAPYGPRMRAWKARDGSTVDQVEYTLDLLRHNPESRRIMISLWDPADMPDESISPQDNVRNGKPCLTPCHWAIEFYTDELTHVERVQWLVDNNPHIWDKWVKENGDEHQLDAFLEQHNVPTRYLDLKWHQRSVDFCVGLPYNIASYGLMLLMYAKTLNMIPRELEFDGTNVHVYKNHTEGLVQQFSRTPRELPIVEIVNKHDRLEDYEWEDIAVAAYDPHPFIKFDVAV